MLVNEPVVSHRKIIIGSNRNFALVVAGFFVVVALIPLLHGNSIRWWAAAIATVILAIGSVAPRLLSPLNRLWFQLGLALSRMISPIVMGIVYYAALVPTSLILRVRGKDPLGLRREPGTPTYWIRREPPGPDRGSMSRQF